MSPRLLYLARLHRADRLHYPERDDRMSMAFAGYGRHAYRLARLRHWYGTR